MGSFEVEIIALEEELKILEKSLRRAKSMRAEVITFSAGNCSDRRGASDLWNSSTWQAQLR